MSATLGGIEVYPDGSKAVVDYAGVALLHESRDGWECLTLAANWPAWVEFAQIILAIDAKGGDPNS